MAWRALIAEIMLQRTRAKNVVPVYERLVREYSTPAALANAGLSRIDDLIHPLGLRWRAPLILELARVLAVHEMPVTYNELVELPGVGDYVASAWLSLHSGKRGVLVDANVVRWMCRVHGQTRDGETRRKAWVREAAERLTPKRSFRAYNYAVLDFTMTVCSTKPHCDICPLRAHQCAFRANSQGLN